MVVCNVDASINNPLAFSLLGVEAVPVEVEVDVSPAAMPSSSSRTVTCTSSQAPGTPAVAGSTVVSQ
jgi:hypothetical protein